MKDKEKKYIVNYRNGIKFFLILIVLALIVFSIFYLIQNKKDHEFQAGRPNIKAFADSLKNK